MKIVAWIVLASLILILLGFCFYLLFGKFLFNFVFGRKNTIKQFKKKDFAKKVEEYKIDACWWEKQQLEDVFVQNLDLKLHGVFLDNKSNKTVILAHGIGWDFRQMQPYAKMFFQRSFNVLAIDLRAHGQSEGRCVGFGFLEKDDINKWVEFANSRIPDGKIVLFGVSLGAASVCMSASENLENVVAIISDCSYDNADRQIEYIIKKHKIPLRKLIKKHLYSFTKHVYGFDVTQADVVGQVRYTNVPILFIHSVKDDYVPIENLNNLYAASPQNFRDKFVVEDGGHALSYAAAGVLYEKKVFDFLKQRTPIF